MKILYNLYTYNLLLPLLENGAQICYDVQDIARVGPIWGSRPKIQSYCPLPFEAELSDFYYDVQEVRLRLRLCIY